MKCVICKRESPICCSCGFCQECIDKYGHDECYKLALEID